MADEKQCTYLLSSSTTCNNTEECSNKHKHSVGPEILLPCGSALHLLWCLTAALWQTNILRPRNREKNIFPLTNVKPEVSLGWDKRRPSLLEEAVLKSFSLLARVTFSARLHNVQRPQSVTTVSKSFRWFIWRPAQAPCPSQGARMILGHAGTSQYFPCGNLLACCILFQWGTECVCQGQTRRLSVESEYWGSYRTRPFGRGGLG